MLVCVVLSLLAACGGPGGGNATQSDAAVDTTAAPDGSEAPTTTVSTTGSPSGKTTIAGPEVSAFMLLDAAGYEAALGAPLRGGPQDNGGVPDPYVGGYTSTALVVTADDMEVTATLHSLPTPEAAQEIYDGLVSQSPGAEPIAGAGEAAAYLGGVAYVKKGAQVLEIGAQFGPDANAAIEQIKLETGDASAQAEAMTRVVITVAPALATEMSGATGDESLAALPEGGVDACASVDVVAELFDDPAAMVERQQTMDPPASECRYTVFGMELTATVVTEDQLQQGARPETLQARFDGLAENLDEEVQQVTEAFVTGDRTVLQSIDDCLIKLTILPYAPTEALEAFYSAFAGVPTDQLLSTLVEVRIIAADQAAQRCCRNTDKIREVLDDIDASHLSTPLKQQTKSQFLLGLAALCRPQLPGATQPDPPTTQVPN
jgi:hypothetical protein